MVKLGVFLKLKYEVNGVEKHYTLCNISEV